MAVLLNINIAINNMNSDITSTHCRIPSVNHFTLGILIINIRLNEYSQRSFINEVSRFCV